ncbi:MAG: glyceraldehyde 3-phosphate dehydrogenase NAD-binding domain-containing protein [Acidimicrobiia bacterium]|nr:glyceraldehyde 3-phosphate dehydrogenase NAD-binding domain-containing protein [Acidimicrobiia bacterium]
MTHAPTRVGLFGFGRIGRNVFRQLEDHPDLEVAAIVDIADPAALVYLLKYDTVFGRFPKPVELENGHLVVGDRRIPMLDHADPGDVDWAGLGVDIVVQATRKHRTMDQLQGHLDRGARRVILASTPKDDTIPTLLMGVNDHTLDPHDSVIALGSNTSNALAPILKILDDRFGIDAVMYTVVHAFTNEQRLADVPGDDLRNSRSAAENIIPTATNSVEIIEHVLPSLAGKLSGSALNVPVADGSNVDLVAILDTEVTQSDVNGAVRWAASNSTVVEYTDDPIVSTDIIGNTHSAIFDGLATLVMDGTMLKAVVWFDNGWGYAARAIELMEKFAAYDAEEVTV